MWFRGVTASVGLCFDLGVVLEGHPDVVLAVNGDVALLSPSRLAMSRRIAVDLCDAIISLRPEWHNDDLDKGSPMFI